MIRFLRAFYWRNLWVQTLVSVLGCIFVGLLMASPVIISIIMDLLGAGFNS